MLKTGNDIYQIKQLGIISRQLINFLVDNTKAGVTTEALNDMAVAFLKEKEVTSAFLGYQKFPKSICTSVNLVATHGVPSNYVLKYGDIISLDVGIRKGEYCTDSAFTIPIGEPSKENQNLLEGTLKCLEAGIKATKVDTKVSDIALAMINEAEKYDLKRDNNWALGHGTGFKVHESPTIGLSNKTKIKENMVLAIEPILTDGKNSACFEHTVVVYHDAVEVIT